MSPLAALPVELVELICSHIVDSEYLSLTTYRLCHLRLTCRALNKKTYEFYTKAAFRKISIHLDTYSLSRLLLIAEAPALASKVETLSLALYDLVVSNHNEYEQTRECALSPDSTAEQREDALSLLREADAEQDDKDLVQRYVLTP